MNPDYVNDLLYEESVKYNGYTSRSIHEVSDAGNDYYGDILDNRAALINKIDKTIAQIEAIKKRTDVSQKIKDQLEAKAGKLTEQKSRLENFGYKAIKYRNKYYYLASQQQELNERFTNMYYNYRVGYNTAEQFQQKLQALFDNIAPMYENRLRIQKMYEKEILNNDSSLKEDVNLDDISESDTVAGGFYFNEQDADVKRPSVENTTGIKSKTRNMQLRLKNIASGYLVDYSVLNDYLKEFGILFIRVWSDRTEW